MLSDSSHEIRQQADFALAEFLQEIKNAPVQAESWFNHACFLGLTYHICPAITPLNLDFQDC